MFKFAGAYTIRKYSLIPHILGLNPVAQSTGLNVG